MGRRGVYGRRGTNRVGCVRDAEVCTALFT